jgi:hypothetical protein
MASLAIRCIGMLFLSAVLLAPAMVQAEIPAHLVLARPQATSFYSPYSPARKLAAQPYPYGYFGARPTVQWQRQFGVYRTYTQWSQK